MKKLFLALCASLLALGASAQNAGTFAGLTYVSDGTQTLSGGTNIVAGNTTNTTAFRVDCPRTENVVLFCQFKLMSGAGTTNLVFNISRCADTSNCETNTTVTPWAIPANGTTLVAAVTNFSVGALPYLRISSVGNGTAQVVTNLVFSYGFKR